MRIKCLVTVVLLIALVQKKLVAQSYNLPIYDSLKVKYKKTRYNNLYINDSASHILTKYSIEAVSSDNTEPAIYLVEQKRVSGADTEYNMILSLSCERNSFLGAKYNQVEACQYWRKADSNFVIAVSMLIDSTGHLSETQTDSILSSDFDCLLQFYSQENDTVNIDTIFGRLPDDFDYVFWKCSYLYDLKHGKEQGYYQIHEIINSCIDSKKDLLKYEGKWKYAQKHGWWKYYSPQGEEIKREKYKNGTRKK